MSTNGHQCGSATVMCGTAATAAESPSRLRDALAQLKAWIEWRREARMALDALHRMSDRELHDMGLARGDIERVARQHPPGRPTQLR